MALIKVFDFNEAILTILISYAVLYDEDHSKFTMLGVL